MATSADKWGDIRKVWRILSISFIWLQCQGCVQWSCSAAVSPEMEWSWELQVVFTNTSIFWLEVKGLMNAVICSIEGNQFCSMQHLSIYKWTHLCDDFWRKEASLIGREWAGHDLSSSSVALNVPGRVFKSRLFCSSEFYLLSPITSSLATATWHHWW